MAIKNVKINNKPYKVPPVNFADVCRLEEDGDISLLNTVQKGKFFVLGWVAIMHIVGCDKDEAMYLMEQHVAGGGKLPPIYEGFNKALEESAFFQKILQESKETEQETKETTEEQ
jgi:hypothetical protein